MVRRQHVDQRAEPDATCALCRGGKEHARRRRHIERRRMMLADVISAKACPVVEFDQREPLLVLLGERIRPAVVLVEDAELHRASAPPYSAACATGLPTSASSLTHSAR